MKNGNKDEYIGKSLLKVFDAISKGVFGNRDELVGLIDGIRNRNDFYLVCHDFYSYCEAQDRVFNNSALYQIINIY